MTKPLAHRGGRHQQMHTPTQVVACRYWYELTDGFWGQFAVTQIPHMLAKHLLPQRVKHLVSMQNFVGVLEYMCNWWWGDEPGIIKAEGATVFPVDALPMMVGDDGEVVPLGTYVARGVVFSSDRAAFEYLLA